MIEENNKKQTIFSVWRKRRSENARVYTRVEKFNIRTFIIAVLTISVTSGVGFGFYSLQESEYIEDPNIFQKRDFALVDYVFKDGQGAPDTTIHKNALVNLSLDKPYVIYNRQKLYGAQSLNGMTLKSSRTINLTFPVSSNNYSGRTYSAIVFVSNIFKNQVGVEGFATLEEDDMAIFDYKGYLDDVPFSGGAAKNATLVIGSDSFIDGFEDEMIGMKTGEKKTIDVTFPTDYNSATLAGKAVQFDLFLRHIVKEEDLTA